MSDHIKTTIKQAAQLLNPMNNRDIIGLSNERRRTKAKGHKWSTGCKAFEKFGYSVKKGKGDHINLVKTGSTRLTIPLHDELSVGLLMNEIKKAGLTVAEFIDLLKD